MHRPIPDPSQEGNWQIVGGTQIPSSGGAGGGFAQPPAKPMNFVSVKNTMLGEIYLMNLPRTATSGFDWFVPAAALGAVADKLITAAKRVGGRACGWQSLETARIEAGIPRFGADMDETNLPLEAGIETRAGAPPPEPDNADKTAAKPRRAPDKAKEKPAKSKRRVKR